ncbi:ferrous iron transport protein A [Persephonella hydrogeniphila]|uniref:Ferrous iron transport protein A n=1 Tax=Persephonella hydrogeniphila TaxID=198703 RepID=A0A285NFU2_9AQUI|nr:FeoA family protein [Persephonella hydrogeniphila]SNZ07837.1 ferrous iron transport protein A [Persephonella hydrogeniphila]
MKLSELEKGKKCKIKGLNFPPEMKRKLLELGLFPGQIIEVVQDAPFGGPVKIKVKDYCFALRKSEAENIEVEECNGE